MAFRAPKTAIFAAACLVVLVAAVAVLSVTLSDFGKGQQVPARSDPAEARVGGFYRLTEAQYRQVIHDVLGASIDVGGQFQPIVREEGLLAVGAGEGAISSSGLEFYDAMARQIAAQAMTEPLRTILLQCTPRDEAAPDDACARQFLARTGRLLFRRPMSPDQAAVFVQIAGDTTRKLGNFYRGLQESLATMLIDPRFLFRIEMLEPDPRNPGHLRLDAFSRASRLSFWLWNSLPDEELLSAAESGDLFTDDGLSRQVGRLLDSPKLVRGVRAFFEDMLRFDKFEILSKDASIFPKFTSAVSEQASEQTLRTIVHHLLIEQGDYRDLFTLRETFLTRTLGAVYGVPVISHFENGAPEPWVPHVYPENDPRAGILSDISFVALHSHSGRSSPTLRGMALREIFLCQEVPPPPGDVDFSRFESADTAKLKTMRQRLSVHVSVPSCAGCHKLTDPIGLALETFDGGGSFRTMENGAAIDTSGVLNGESFQNASGLGRVVRNDPAATACVVKQAFAYGAGREPDRQTLEQIEEEFADSDFRFVDLLRTIAMDDSFLTPKLEQAQLAAHR